MPLFGFGKKKEDPKKTQTSEPVPEWKRIATQLNYQFKIGFEEEYLPGNITKETLAKVYHRLLEQQMPGIYIGVSLSTLYDATGLPAQEVAVFKEAIKEAVHRYMAVG